MAGIHGYGRIRARTEGPYLVYYKSGVVDDPEYKPFMTIYAESEEKARKAFLDTYPLLPILRVEKQEVMN